MINRDEKIIDMDKFKTGVKCVTSVHGKRGTIDYDCPITDNRKEVCPKCGSDEFFIDHKRFGERRCRKCYYKWIRNN